MATELTFAIIKPDAVAAGNTGHIVQRILDNGFKVRGMRLIHMTQADAEGFYAVHSERPFFKDLVGFMTSLDRQWSWHSKKKTPSKPGAI